MRLAILLAFLLLSLSAAAQQSLLIAPTFEGKLLQLNKSYFSAQHQDSISIATLRFYISDLTFYQDEHAIFSLPKKYWLLDLEEINSLSQLLEFPEGRQPNKIKFKLGIDSLTNVSGAMAGDLDPTKGMYWTWQSGYVNFKLEGQSSICPARNNRFQFHIGGYVSPNLALQFIEMTLPKRASWTIELAIDQLLAKIDLKNNYKVMSPNARAMETASLLPHFFSIRE